MRTLGVHVRTPGPAGRLKYRRSAIPRLMSEGEPDAPEGKLNWCGVVLLVGIPLLIIVALFWIGSQIPST